MEQHAGLIIHLACGRSKHNLMTFFLLIKWPPQETETRWFTIRQNYQLRCCECCRNVRRKKICGG